MGSHPGTRGPAWLGASALLAVQITVTALASAPAPASADGSAAATRNLPSGPHAGLYSSPGLDAGHAARTWRHAEAVPAHRLARPAGRLRAQREPARTTTPAKKATGRAAGSVEAAVKALRLIRTAKALAALKAGVVTGRVSPVLWRQHLLFRDLRLPHQQAANRLKHAGLGWRSSGNCVDRRRSTCTSLDTVRLGTLWGVVDLKRRSGCRVVLTGGTETGHAHGTRSHGNGYKVDIEHNRCVDRFIRGKRSGAIRKDGAGLYHERRPSGHTVYADEPSHWDIAFT
ncbi:hypothetical protein GCM10009677_04850 [Sphaerisporangium rubeum]|uniref:Peptidase M15B domain-containing protein n=1 Tax=Sphaerisporangium rubeum TaxID=321317 RepID=A0A7X0M591_9ACTN|nr:hypothetical protein [Sphaerisporangium rubeum]MBB6470674.1 hypothetical protein [Sphaerisporangium rubeum]